MQASSGAAVGSSMKAEMMVAAQSLCVSPSWPAPGTSIRNPLLRPSATCLAYSGGVIPSN